jgi:hypothetical protein
MTAPTARRAKNMRTGPVSHAPSRSNRTPAHVVAFRIKLHGTVPSINLNSTPARFTCHLSQAACKMCSSIASRNSLAVVKRRRLVPARDVDVARKREDSSRGTMEPTCTREDLASMNPLGRSVTSRACTCNDQHVQHYMLEHIVSTVSSAHLHLSILKQV